MKTQYLKIEALVIDNDEAKFRVSAGNGNASSSIEVFGYLDEFRIFGEALSSFPKSSEEILKYELGNDFEDWAYYLLIKVYCYDPSGQTGIQVKINNKQEVPELIETNFYIKTYPASVNKLGESLSNWEPDINSTFEWSLDTS